MKERIVLYACWNRIYDSLNVLYAVHSWNHGKNRHLNREYDSFLCTLCCALCGAEASLASSV